MADFLQRISERALGLAPVAQPIIASMFAPAPPLPASTETLLEVDEFVEAQPLTRPLRHVAAVVSPPAPVAHASQQPGVTSISSFVPSIDQSTPAPGRPMARAGKHTLPASEARASLVNTQDRITQPYNALPRQEAAPFIEDEPGTISPTPQREVYGQKAPAMATLQDANSVPVEANSQVNELLLQAPPVQTGAAEPAHTPRQAGTPVVEQERIVPVNWQPALTGTNIPSPAHEQTLIVRVDRQIVSHSTQVSQEGSAIAPSQRPLSVPVEESGSHNGAQTSPLTSYDSTGPLKRDLLMPEKLEEREPATRRMALLDALPTYDGVVVGGQPRQVEQAPRGAVAQNTAGAPETSGDAPTIRVTIGRVDVHAVTAPPASHPRASRAAPSLSLADYARQNRKER